MKYIVIRLLLFFYLTSTYLSAIHIHSDALTSVDDCKVHIMVKNLNSADIPHSSFQLLNCISCFQDISFNIYQLIYPLIKGFNSQAPPFFF